MPDGIIRWPDRPVSPGQVAVITVSYNTRELTAEGAAAAHDELMTAFRAEVGSLDDQQAVEALTGRGIRRGGAASS
jgi:hypothetical protein